MRKFEIAMWDKTGLQEMPGLKNTKKNLASIDDLRFAVWKDPVNDEKEWAKVQTAEGENILPSRLGFGVNSKNAPCANICRFCRRRVELLTSLNINPDYVASDKVIEKSSALLEGSNPIEIVATGGVLGEPFLFEPKELAIMMKSFAKKYPNVPHRINTTGNMFTSQEEAENAIRELKNAIGKETLKIAVSINQIDENDYLHMMCPLDPKGAFDRLKLFIKAAIKVLGRENVIASFVDYSDLSDEEIQKRNWKKIEKSQILEKIENIFNIPSEQVVFRKYGRTHQNDFKEE